MFYIYLWKSDIILFPTTMGHREYLEILAFGKRNRITVLALELEELEGSFKANRGFNYWCCYSKGEVYHE